MPGWAWAIIAVVVGIVVMSVASILLVTFLGESAETKFESVGTAVDSDGNGVIDSGSDGETYGDNAQLDALWDRCEDGSGSACDSLYWGSPVGSEYEAFGNTCGRRFSDEEAPFSCADEIGE